MKIISHKGTKTDSANNHDSLKYLADQTSFRINIHEIKKWECSLYILFMISFILAVSLFRYLKKTLIQMLTFYKLVALRFDLFFLLKWPALNKYLQKKLTGCQPIKAISKAR